MASSFLSAAELAAVGFRSVGTGVLVSRFARIYNPANMSLGNHVRIDDFSVLSAAPVGGPAFSVGSYVHMAAGVYVFGSSGFRMGDFSGFSGGVKIYTATDDYGGDFVTNPTVPARFRRVHGAPLEVGDHVIVGAGTVVLPTAKCLEEGVAVGAQSLVRSPCAAWSVYVGTPAKRVRDRSRGVQELVKELC
jgi:galactoside O-acetyltransferase